MKVWLGTCSAMSSPVYAANGPQRGRGGAKTKEPDRNRAPLSVAIGHLGATASTAGEAVPGEMRAQPPLREKLWHPDLRVGRPGGLGGIQPARQAAAPACRGVLVHRRGAGDLV